MRNPSDLARCGRHVPAIAFARTAPHPAQLVACTVPVAIVMVAMILSM